MRIARLVTAAVAATALVVFTGGAPAWAHNALTKASPAKNATVEEAPARVELTFLDRLDDTFAIEVTDAQKEKVPTGRTEVDGKKGSAEFTGELANGTYTVTYKLVAADGDATQSSYKFTVAAPEAALSPSATASAEPVPSPSPATIETPATIAASDTSTDEGTNWGLIIAIIAGVAVLAAGAVLIGRRRRNP